MSQTVVITGASAGVGRALACEYAQRGARVALLARGAAGLQAAADDVRARGGRALVLAADVADPEQVDRAADRVATEFGPIDVWVNNAMVTVMSPLWEVTPEEYRRVTEVNYLGVVHGSLAALRHMRPRDRGSIIQVGSALAFRGIPEQAPYCATKHAVQGFTESLHAELLAEDSGIHVGLVHLPALNTPQFIWSRNRLPNAPQPVPPIYQPEVAARAIVRASERHDRETWVAGTTFATVWANRLAGGLIARYLARTGIEDQQLDQPASLRPDDNLDAPLDDDRDYGAHGPFDARARDAEATSRLTSTPVRALVGAIVAAGTVALVKERRHSGPT